MRVLFLDIDGVLNSHEFFERRTKPQQFSGMCELCVDLMSRFDRIVEETGCKVVLSSTWRLSPTYMHDLEVQGLNTNAIIDRTPTWHRPPDTGWEWRERGKQIAEWLAAHPEVTRYTILDDDSDMLDEQTPSFFKTSTHTGLTDEIASAVIAHLNA